MDYAKMLKPQKVKASASTQGAAGYDNPRENIDPNIKTKILDANVILASEKIGIGTRTPNCMLRVANSTTGVSIGPYDYPAWLGANGLYATGSIALGQSILCGSGFYLSFGEGQTTLVGYGTTGPPVNSYFRWQTDSTERMRLNKDGYLGINIQSPAYYLDVNGAAYIRNTNPIRVGDGALSFVVWSSSGGIYGSFNIGNSADEDIAILAGSSTARFYIDASSGNTGMGTTTPNAAALLDLVSTTKGFKLMNMSTTDRDNISTPPEGLMIWNSTTHKLNVYSGTGWEVVVSA